MKVVPMADIVTVILCPQILRERELKPDQTWSLRSVEIWFDDDLGAIFSCPQQVRCWSCHLLKYWFCRGLVLILYDSCSLNILWLSVQLVPWSNRWYALYILFFFGFTACCTEEITCTQQLSLDIARTMSLEMMGVLSYHWTAFRDQPRLLHKPMCHSW